MKPNELLLDAKDLKPTRGIYMILCIPTNQAYIGQSVEIHQRWRTHKDQLKHGKHINKDLQRVFNKYGPSFFHFSVLEHCEKTELNEREIHYITKIDPGLCFNVGVPILDPISDDFEKGLSELVSNFTSLLTLCDLEFKIKGSMVEVKKPGSFQVFEYDTLTRRWRVKFKNKSYNSKSGSQFIVRFVLGERK